MDALTIAIATSGLTRDLKEGRVDSGGLSLDHIEITPITAAMRRMVRALEFDISEMAITTYLCARAHGVPVTAIPVFVTRNFHHGAVFRRAGCDIEKPKDLEGRTVGVNRGYTVTTGLWARGILRDEYGVDLDSITWAATDDEHVAEFEAPANVSYANQGRAIAELLADGTVDAAVGAFPAGVDGIERLIPDAAEAGAASYRKTGVYPINHTIVIKDSVLAANPEVAPALFRAFKASKDAYLARLDAGDAPEPFDKTAQTLAGVVGDPFPFGVAANRKALETVVGYARDQRVIAAAPDLDGLFAAGTADLA